MGEEPASTRCSSAIEEAHGFPPKDPALADAGAAFVLESKGLFGFATHPHHCRWTGFAMILTKVPAKNPFCRDLVACWLPSHDGHRRADDTNAAVCFKGDGMDRGAGVINGGGCRDVLCLFSHVQGS